MRQQFAQIKRLNAEQADHDRNEQGDPIGESGRNLDHEDWLDQFRPTRDIDDSWMIERVMENLGVRLTR